MNIQAFVLRTHNNAGENPVQIKAGRVIPLPTTQFNDLRDVGLVRAATKKEIADAKGEKVGGGE